MFTELIQSPLTYLVLLVSFAGGYYARGNTAGALFFGWFAPLLMLPMWFVILLAMSLPLRLADALFPSLMGKLETVVASDSLSSGVSALVFNPNLLAGVVAVALFAGLCRYERKLRLADVTAPLGAKPAKRRIDSHAVIPSRVWSGSRVGPVHSALPRKS